MNVSLDDILSKNAYIVDTQDTQDTQDINITNTKSKSNTTTTTTTTTSNSNSNSNSKRSNKSKKTIIDSNTTSIDNILNNGLVKFDNKYQISMFFVCSKALTTFCNDIKSLHNITISKEFIDTQITNMIPNIIKEYTGNMKKRCKKAVNPDTICLGRKLDNKQCTRKKHNDAEFCKSHMIKLSNGRIDHPNQSNIRNKRGRKRKVEFDPRQYDNEYVTLWEDIIDGEKVLIDSNSNIYTFDLETPQYIGKKEIDNKIDIKTILKDIEYKKLLKQDTSQIDNTNSNNLETNTTNPSFISSNELNESNDKFIENIKENIIEKIDYKQSIQSTQSTQSTQSNTNNKNTHTLNKHSENSKLKLINRKTPSKK